MQGVLITVPTHRGFPYPEVKNAIRQLCSAGAELLVASDISDIAGGRSWLLSTALRAAEERGRDVIVMIDDDIAFTPAQAEQLVQCVRDTGYPVSGVYPTKLGGLAGTRWKPWRYLVGLGFAAVSVKRLRQLADTLRPTKYGSDGIEIWPFCTSGPNYDVGRWFAEDYAFCALLDGFYLAPISVGHIKAVPLVADAADVQRVTDWTDLTEPPGGWLGNRKEK